MTDSSSGDVTVAGVFVGSFPGSLRIDAGVLTGFEYPSCWLDGCCCRGEGVSSFTMVGTTEDPSLLLLLPPRR